jgi:phosphoribosylglycinamide formyltransferase-1
MSARVAVFASGGGTNLQALLDHFNRWESEVARVVLVVSDRPGAGALDRARDVGVAAHVVAVAGRAEEEVARETLNLLEAFEVDLIALAGYLRLVPAAVVRRYEGRMLNIHPALLPAFGGKGMYGLRVHQAVIEAGCRVSGATVHFVTEEYDRGPILIQWPVPVLAGDTPETLAARVLRVEHRIYPAAVEALARAVERGETVRATAAPGALHFGLLDGEAPTEEEIRKVLGF